MLQDTEEDTAPPLAAPTQPQRASCVPSALLLSLQTPYLSVSVLPFHFQSPFLPLFTLAPGMSSSQGHSHMLPGLE